jgi:predicted GNAT family acetyltransferase
MIDRFDNAGELLTRCEDALFAGGAECELTLGLLRRLVVKPDAWGSDVLLLLAGDEKGAPWAVVTKTGIHPLLVTGFVDEAYVDFGRLADAILAARDDIRLMQGPVRWSTPLSAALAERLGVEPVVGAKHRAFELRTLRAARPVDGMMRLARADEMDLLLRFCRGFAEDALRPDEQQDDHRPLVERLLSSDDLVLWDVDGTPVSMAAINRRTGRSSCVSMVYTPRDLRGRGYASSVVAALTQRELDAGAEWCSLFTDAANPTSNHIYQELGYEFKVDFQFYDLKNQRIEE